MNKRVTAMVMATMLASPLMMAQIGMAASGKGKMGTALSTSTSSQRVRLEAGLKATGVTGVEAEAKYEKRTDSAGTIREKFEAEFEAPLTFDPAITDASTFTLMVGGATCTLVFDEIETELIGGVAVDVREFKVVVEQRTPAGGTPVLLAPKYGDCGGVFPMIVEGGSASLTVGATTFSGTFKKH